MLRKRGPTSHKSSSLATGSRNGQRGSAGYYGSNRDGSSRSMAKLCGTCVLFVMLCVALPVFYYHQPDQQQQRQRQQLNKAITMAGADVISSGKKKTSTINRNTKEGTGNTSTRTTTTDNASESKVHIVFSTDCSAFQHWQSYLLFYSAYRINQPGKITRIASGCTDEEEAEEQAWHNQHISSVMTEDYTIHFTPHFSAVKDASGEVKGDYKFFNKPMGLKHWMENSPDMGVDGGVVLPEHEDTIVALLDPDQLLLKQIGDDFSDLKLTLVSKFAEEGRKFKVEHGTPFGQHYGLGTKWREFNADEITGDPNSHVKKVKHAEAAKHYPVGPPYIGTARDMYQISLKWVEFVPKVHKEYPYLLAEMYAYCMAAAHLDLPHQLVDHLMISNVNCGGEGWPFVDALKQNTGEENVCETMMTGSVDLLNSPQSAIPLPTVIHFCQRYTIGDTFFGKRKTPTDFFTCEHPLLKEPAFDLDRTTYKIPTGKEFSEANKEEFKQPIQSVRESFTICGITRIMNEAGEFFKSHGCDGVENVNTEKSYDMHASFRKGNKK